MTSKDEIKKYYEIMVNIREKLESIEIPESFDKTTSLMAFDLEAVLEELKLRVSTAELYINKHWKIDAG